MSTVGASVKVGAQAPPIVWLVLSAVVVGAVIMWSQFGQDPPEDGGYLDPGQPPLSARVDFATTIPGGYTAPGAAPYGRRPTRKFPFDSLMQHPCCWVGDC